MRLRRSALNNLIPLLLLEALPVRVSCTDILRTSGFSTCLDSSAITVQKVDVQYNRADNTVTFDVAGTSSKSQDVTGVLTVTAYGNQVYQQSFDPCDNATKVEQLCPGMSFQSSCHVILNTNKSHDVVPVGQFAAQGNLSIPSNYASMIPSIAFQVPDLDGMAQLVLKSKSDSQEVACLQSVVNNGKTVNVPAVSYVAASVAGAALIMSGVSAFSATSGANGGVSTTPSFTDVVGWFQAMALNGMLSVDYPPIYRNFAKNFGWSTGLIPWNSMQESIDNFRKNTGGNLTGNSVDYLKNATLVYQDPNEVKQTAANVTKRGIDLLFITARDFSSSVNSSNPTSGSSNTTDNKAMHFVKGIQGYAEQLMIPEKNTFMTVLLIFGIVIAAIVVGILFFKVILETWALFASFPKNLTGFRKRYWGTMGRTIVNLILIVYGVWVLYCIFQFTNGDSWAAKLLAGITLAVFTGILGYFTYRIWSLARKSKQTDGDASKLYDDKETWVKYSLFYDQYKKDLWWIFIPAIIYMFAKGFIIAAGNGHGLVQGIGQLVCEGLLLALLLWNRPYVTTAGNVIHIIISIARVLSVVCVLVFASELRVQDQTKTITGVVLIAVQSVLTGLLAILIAVNAIIICCKENPHRKRRKEAGKIPIL
jgi:Transient receptor potential (TRP) ion channel/ML-like domain